MLPALYVVEALVFAALAFLAYGDRFFLPLVLRWALVDGTLAITGRGLTRGAVAARCCGPQDLLSEGNALMNLGFAASSVFGAALGGALIAAFGVVGGAAGRRRLVPGHRRRCWATRAACPALEHADYQPWRDRFRAGLSFVRAQPPCARC